MSTDRDGNIIDDPEEEEENEQDASTDAKTAALEEVIKGSPTLTQVLLLGVPLTDDLLQVYAQRASELAKKKKLPAKSIAWMTDYVYHRDRFELEKRIRNGKTQLTSEPTAGTSNTPPPPLLTEGWTIEPSQNLTRASRPIMRKNELVKVPVTVNLILLLVTGSCQ